MAKKTLYIDLCDNVSAHLEYTFTLTLIPEPTPTPPPTATLTPSLTPTLTNTPAPSVSLRLTWGDDFLAISNPEDNEVALDLRGLVFWRSDGSQFVVDENGDPGQLANLESGDCIVIYSFNSLGGEAPEIDDVRTRAVCTNAIFVPTFAGNLFWTVINDFFEVQQDDRFIGYCDLGQNRICMIELSADLESQIMETNE